MPDRGKQVHGVPCKPWYALGQHDVHLPRLAVRDKAEELAARRRPGPADPKITLCQEEDLKKFKLFSKSSFFSYKG